MKLFTITFAAFCALLIILNISSGSVSAFFFDTTTGINYFKSFCNKNQKLCDEINKNGMQSRHDLLSEFGSEFYQSTLQTLVENFFGHFAKTGSKQQREMPSVFRKFLDAKQHEETFKRKKQWVHQIDSADVKELRSIFGNSTNPFPYFGFVPYYYQNVKLGENATITGAGTATFMVGGLNSTCSTITVSVNFVSESAWSPIPEYYLLTVGHSTVEATMYENGYYSFVLNVSSSMSHPALVWDINNRGVRIFRNVKDKLLRDLDTIDTLLLFKPMLTKKLDPESAQRNIDFLNNYTKMRPFTAPRPQGIVNIRTNTDIRTGDLFAKMELDGLGPIENLGQGTTAGHVATALHDDNGNLQVCESIIRGITCTPYQEWLQALQDTGEMVVLIPLAEQYLKNYNKSAAWSWINKTYANAYGYPNFLTGWFDTSNGMNLPCFPSENAADNFKRCMSMEAMELFIFHLNELLPGVVDYFVGQALNHRAGTWNLDFPSVLEAGFKNLNGATFNQMMAIPEQDSWLYNTSNRHEPGKHLMLPAQVCSTFGCNILKAAGAFSAIDNDFFCTEITPWDLFSLNIYDKNRMGTGRPQACQTADPSNPLCQLCGNYNFNLVEDFNTRAMWKNMNNNCATKNPAPYNHEGCYGTP